MWHTVDLSLKVKSWQMEEKAPDGEKKSGRKWEKRRKRRYTHEDRGISYRSSRNLRATIRIVVCGVYRVDTKWIKRLWRPSESWIMQRRDPIYNSRKRNMCYVERCWEVVICSVAKKLYGYFTIPRPWLFISRIVNRTGVANAHIKQT